jgi:hypothetical protein
MTTKNGAQAKGTSKQKKVKISSISKQTGLAKQPSDTKAQETTLTVNTLASKLGLTPKRLRPILRSEYPRQDRGKKWEITGSLAKKIEKDLKSKDQAKDQAKLDISTKKENSEATSPVEVKTMEKPEEATNPSSQGEVRIAEIERR